MRMMCHNCGRFISREDEYAEVVRDKNDNIIWGMCGKCRLEDYA